MSYPIMKNIIHELFDFIQNIENNSLYIDTDISKNKRILKYVAGNKNFYADNIEEESQELREGLGIELSENQKELFFIDASKLYWNRGEQISAEGTLAGGFYTSKGHNLRFFKGLKFKIQECFKL